MPATVPASPFPPVAPTISGRLITVDEFLRNPPFVQRAIMELTTQRFVSDVIFSAGPPADGGAVIYNQVSAVDLFLTRDVKEIAPGSEFPILTGPEFVPLVALAKKYGGEVFLTDEEVRRDRRDILNRETIRLRNTIIRKVDTLGMAALRAAPTTAQTASASWAVSTTDIIGDLVVAAGAIDALDLGYVADTVLVNPAQETAMLKQKNIRDALPRENFGGEPLIRTGNLGRLLGMDFIVSNRVNAGEVWVLQRKIVGGISDEVPMYARPIREDRRERVFIHGARVPTIYVTDPLAVVRITGA